MLHSKGHWSSQYGVEVEDAPVVLGADRPGGAHACWVTSFLQAGIGS